MSNFLLSLMLIFETILLQRVLRRTNQSNDSNQQRAHFARQKTMNHFDVFENVVIFMISNNEFYLISLKLVEIVFDDDKHIMFFFVIEISFIHDQKFNVARVLFS